MGNGRKALVVGINHYEHYNNLAGCVDDAYAFKSAIERNGDGTINFDIKTITASGPDKQVTKKMLKKNVEELFKNNSDIALLYFSGHGHIENSGGYLATSEIEEGDNGLSMDTVLKMANESPATNKIIILDCCHSGKIGAMGQLGDQSLLAQGITILTASDMDEYAMEINGVGVFTNLLVDALNGGAANLLGHITPGSVYAHIDQSLGDWGQRPIFKTNIKNFTLLKSVSPAIGLGDLHQITELFKEKGDEFQLTPSYEPESECPKDDHMAVFAILQKYNRVNLVIPVDAPHMYHAAMHSKSCKLTLLGQHYWRLVKKKRI